MAAERVRKGNQRAPAPSIDDHREMPRAERVSIRVDDLDLATAKAGRVRLAGPGVQLVVLMRHRH